MAKIIKFPNNRQKNSPEVIKLKIISDKIDDIILDALTKKTVTPTELAGIMSHRLGNILKHFENKDELWAFCEDVLKNQACLRQK